MVDGAGVGWGGVSGAGVSGAGTSASSNSLDIYGRPEFLFDVPNSQYRNGLSGGTFRDFASLSGLTFTRASVGYAQNQAGVLQQFASGAPRITDRGLLIEGARTNLCLRSQEFDNGTWGKTESSISADQASAPDSTVTADAFIESVNSTPHYTEQPITKAASAITYSLSVYVRRTSVVRNVELRADALSAANSVIVPFNLGTVSAGSATVAGTFSSVSSSIESLGGGWFRCVIVVTTGTETTVRFRVTSLNSSMSSVYAGDGVTPGLYLWGAQLEAAAFPSSYIPTTSASVTRPADVCSIAVSGISYPATLFAEFERVVDTGGDEGLFQVDDGSSNNRSLLNVKFSDLIQMYVRSASVDQANNTIAGALALNTTYRAAIRVATNDAILSRSGLLGTQDTSVTVPATPTTIRLGQQTTSVSACFGFIKRAAVWSNQAFTDAQLQAVSA